MTDVSTEIRTVSNVLRLELCIPDYQRPYTWATTHVYRLLDDLLEHQSWLQGDQRYRLGTVVLHQDDNKPKNIVDGQQRLVTLSLILRWLTARLGQPTEQSDSAAKFLDLAYDNHLKKHQTSRTHLKENWDAIHHYLEQRLRASQREALKSFIEEQCEFVVVTLQDLSEAFQFFDSQNARGKSLEPYDLLKAFHLREMNGVPEEEKRECVARWEKSVDDGTLKELFDDYLYRIRRWMRGESGLEFGKDDIDLFKGVNLADKIHDFPYVLPHRMVESFVVGYGRALQAWAHQADYPFQIGQTIVNGKRFFDYVAHYEQLLKCVKNRKSKIIDVLNSYEGRHRTGDGYTRNLFNAALLCFVDRFGEEAVDEIVIRQCYAWAYAIRFEKLAVRKVTMDEKGKEPNGLIRRMQYLDRPDDVARLPMPLPELKDKDKKDEGNKHPAAKLAEGIEGVLRNER